jgi:hypothetical protein
VLAPEELLAGANIRYTVEVPSHILHPVREPSASPDAADGMGTVVLRPLTVRDLQMVARAAKESDTLAATLMVHRALVEPPLSVQDLAGAHVGLLQFLLDQVNRISGISASSDDLADAASAPLVKAAFILAEEYGWTPQQVQELTLGQVLLHLQMLHEKAHVG